MTSIVHSQIVQAQTEGSHPKAKKVFRSIEILRFLAAALVFLAHYPYKTSIPILDGIVGGDEFSGAIGVDIFFIISGFVMYNTSQSTDQYGKKAFTIFIINRVFRIFPLYILVTLLYIVLSGNNYSGETILSSLLLVPLRNEEQIYLDPIVSLGWTLMFEMFFYCIVSLGILTGKKNISTNIGVIAVVVIGFYFSNFYSSPIILEFLLGYWLGFLFLRYARKTSNVKSIHVYILCIFSIVLLIFVSTGSDSVLGSMGVERMGIDFNGYVMPRFIFWGLPSALLVASFLLLEDRVKINNIYHMGKYTYSLYLLQVFPLGLILKTGEIITPALLFLITSLLWIAISMSSYHFFEKPLIVIGKKLPVKIYMGKS